MAGTGVTPEEREDLLAAYALGSLSAPDAEEVEALVARDPEAAADLAAYHEIVSLIALSVPMRRADPSLRRRVLEHAQREARERQRRRAGAPALVRYLPAAAMVGAVVVLGLWALSLQSALSDMRADLAALTSVVESDAKQLDALVGADGQSGVPRSITLARVLEDQQVLAAVQTDPDVVTTNLVGTAEGRDAGGRYLWSKAAGAGVVVAHGLPPLPIGSVYRVWIEDRFSRLVAGATFDADEKGHAQVVVRAEGNEEPVRIYVVATANHESQTVDGPVVLQGTISTNRPATSASPSSTSPTSTPAPDTPVASTP